MPAARGYVRVSTEDQAQNGVSIEAQQQILNAYAVVKGFDDFEVYTDGGYSGKNMNRPGLQQLVADCRAQRVTAVVVWRPSRPPVRAWPSPAPCATCWSWLRTTSPPTA